MSKRMSKTSASIAFLALLSRHVQPADAFATNGKSDNTRMASLRLELQPDGFMSGDNFDRMSPGYREQYRYYDQRGMNDDINPELGGALARGPVDAGDEQPTIRMDASAPRRQTYHPGTGRQSSTVQGAGSRATYVSPDPYGFDEMTVHLGTEGRPLYANVEHWSGPNNVPSKMQLYSEDGGSLPWITKFKTPNNIDSGVTQVRNVGPMEFPLQASVSASNSQPLAGPAPGSRPGGESAVMPSGNLTPWKTIDGGSLKTFGFDGDVDYVYLEIASEGLPVNARVELWQGPSNTKAIGNVYIDHGLKRPWSALIPIQGSYGGASICVLNEGPMEYPIEVRMDPPPKSAF